MKAFLNADIATKIITVLLIMILAAFFAGTIDAKQMVLNVFAALFGFFLWWFFRDE